MIKNILFSTAQVVTLATGQTYTLKTDEVLLNGTPYKKRDLEIQLTGNSASSNADNIRIGIRKRDGGSSLPASFSKFDEWQIDGITQTALGLCVENITTAIFIDLSGSASGVGSDINGFIGGVIHVQGLEHIVWASRYNINGVPYNIFISGTVTLDASPTTANFERTDVFAINNDGAGNTSVGFVKGIEGLTALKPSVDALTQKEAGWRLLDTNEVNPPNPLVLIHDENTGNPPEYDVISSPSGTDLESVVAPYKNTKSILLPVIGSIETLVLEGDAINYSTVGLLVLALKTPSEFPNNLRINIFITDKTSAVDSATLTLRRNNILNYGFDHTVLATWQLLAIPMSELTFTKPSYDKITFELINTPILGLDWINSQGVVNIEPQVVPEYALSPIIDDEFSLLKDGLQVSSIDLKPIKTKYLGLYLSLAALQTAHPTALAGNYANVDIGAGNDVQRYLWDVDDAQWVLSSGEVATAPIPLTYADDTELFAAQGAQLTNFIYEITDGSGFKGIQNIKIWVKYLGTTNANETDYRVVSKHLYEPNTWRPEILETNTAQQNADLINADITAAALVDGVVILPAGHFTSRTINWHPRVYLEGAGKNATTITGTNAEPLISYVSDELYWPIGKIEGMRLLGGVDEDNKVSTAGLFIHAIWQFNIREIMFEYFDGYAIDLLGWEVGQIVSCGFHKCVGGINAVRDLTTTVGPLDVNLMSIRTCLFQRLSSWAIQWNRGSLISFDSCDFSNCGTDLDANTGIMKFVNLCPNGESVGFSMNNCFTETNFGTLWDIDCHADGHNSFRNTMVKFGDAPELGMSMDGGQMLFDNSEFAWDIDVLDGVLETRNATIGGIVTLTGTATHKKNDVENLTGVEIDLGCVIGTNYNFASANSGTTYTTINKVEGGFANCLINTTSEPTVTGGTKIAGFTWVTGTNIELVIEVKNAVVRFFFLEI